MTGLLLGIQRMFPTLLKMSLSAGILVLVVILLRLVFRAGPKWVRCLLWLLVAVRLLCPVLPQSRVSLMPSEPIREAQIQSALDAGLPTVEYEAIQDHAVNQAIPEDQSGSVSHTAAPSEYLPFVWALGALLLLLYALMSWLRLRRRVRAAVPLEGNVLLCDAVDSPFILGIFRPKIYLPSGLNEAQRAAVLAHERAHLRRRDHWWKPLGFLLLAIHWFNPLVWLAYILLCRDIELACDEKVVRDLGAAERADYSQTLLDCAVRRPAVRACPLAFGEVGVKERIKRILNYKKPAFWIVAVAVMACVVVAVCFLTRPGGGSAPANPDATPHPTPEPTVTPAPLPTGTPMTEVMDMIDMATAKSYILGEEYYDTPVAAFMRFYILLDMDAGLFQYYETPISSYIGLGRYKLDGDILTIEDNRVNRFRLEDDRLVWLAEGSDNFTFVKLTDGAAFYLEDTAPAAKQQLTLEDVRALAQKGDDLTRADFEPFAYEEVGAGLYIRSYPIDETFDFLIGSASPDSDPMYYYLRNRDANAWIDVRSRDVEGFIAAYTQTEVLTAPPDLSVSAYRAGVQALRGTYSWHYEQGDGTGVGIEADSAHPLSLKGQLPRLSLGPSTLDHIAPNVVTLTFDTAPDAVSVRCWSEDHWGAPDAPAEAVPITRAEYYNLELREGGYIYEITADWNRSDQWGGTVHYSFYGYYSEKD